MTRVLVILAAAAVVMVATAAGPPWEGTGFSGYVLVRNQQYLAPGEHAEVSVSCPEGQRVLGGGFVIETPTDVKVAGSAPWEAGNFVTDRWTVIAQNVGTLTRQVNVVATCAFVGF
jgi:hypothetical protein